jgi:hypothetical protein
VTAVHRAAVVGHPRVALGGRLARCLAAAGAGDLQVGVALVVPEQDVELGVQRLDQVVLEQQRLVLAAHHRGLQPRDARDHQTDAGAAMVLLEIAGDTALEVARLAHVEASK